MFHGVIGVHYGVFGRLRLTGFMVAWVFDSGLLCIAMGYPQGEARDYVVLVTKSRIVS